MDVYEGLRQRAKALWKRLPRPVQYTLTSVRELTDKFVECLEKFIIFIATNPSLMFGTAIGVVIVLVLIYLGKGIAYVFVALHYAGVAAAAAWDILRDIIGGIISDASSLVGGGGGNPLPHISSVPGVSWIADHVGPVLALAEECEPYEGIFVAQWILPQYYLSEEICPVIRYTYFNDWLYAIMRGVLGWASYNAAPFPPHNCHPPLPNIQWCALMECGYLAAGVLVDVWIVLTAIKFWPFIKKSIGVALHIARHAIHVVFHTIRTATDADTYKKWGDSIVHFVHSLRDEKKKRM